MDKLDYLSTLNHLFCGSVKILLDWQPYEGVQVNYFTDQLDLHQHSFDMTQYPAFSYILIYTSYHNMCYSGQL